MKGNIQPGIEVNGIKITPEEIKTEVQYHPAENFRDAKFEAMKALVIREILIQRAAELGLCQRDEAVKKPDEIIDTLLEAEISVPEPDEENCKRYYENNKNKFYTATLYEVSHILYLAPPEEEEARENAKRKAASALERLKEDSTLFETIAKKESACSSSGEGGRLGQISKGQTMPAFETALFKMQEGELSTEPVPTEVGYHIIKVHKRIDGDQLPYETVSDWIADFLKKQSWNRAFNQYLQLLAGRAKISGFRFEGAKSPLVQ